MDEAIMGLFDARISVLESKLTVALKEINALNEQIEQLRASQRSLQKKVDSYRID